MKSAILYPYDHLSGRGCCRFLNPKHAAITAAIYTLNISILVVLLYSWRIGVNMKKAAALEDVYYGVQIAYFAIIGTQLFMIFLSVVLLLGIYRENSSLVIPWIIGFITFMALEAVAMVYSNVLRDHVNKQFDALCKAEVAFFISRTAININSTMNTPAQNVMLDVVGDISPSTEEWFLNQCKEPLPISPATMPMLDIVEDKPLEKLPQHSGSLSNEGVSVLHIEDTKPSIDTSHCVSVDGIKPIPQTEKRLVNRKCPFYFRPNGTRRQFLVWLPSGERLRIYKDEAVKLGYIDAPRTDEDN